MYISNLTVNGLSRVDLILPVKHRTHFRMCGFREEGVGCHGSLRSRLSPSPLDVGDRQQHGRRCGGWGDQGSKLELTDGLLRW